MKQVLFYSGLAVLVLAFVSPIDFLGESRLLFAHMVQHILIAEVGALLVVAGLTGSILRPILALPFSATCARLPIRSSRFRSGR